MRFWLAVAAALLFLQAPAWGQALDQGPQEGFSLDDLDELLNTQVSTATRTEERLDEAPGSLTVITRREIADMHAASMREVLNVLVPGFDVVPLDFVYGDRVNEGIFARGIRNDIIQNVLILWNGQPKFNESTWGGSFTIGDQATENIERIEISRSPVPLYGGAGITIVNIITREQTMEGAEGEVRVSVNEHDDLLRYGPEGKRATVVWGHAVGNWHVSGSVQYYDDRGQPQLNPDGRGGYAYNPNTMRDGTWLAPNFTLSLRSLDDKITVQTWYKYTRQHAFLSGLIPSESTEMYAWWSPAWLSLVKYKPIEGLELTLGSTLSGWAETYDLGGPAGGGESNFDVYLDASYRKQFSLAGSHLLLTGAKLEREGQYDAWVYTWDGHALLEDRTPEHLWSPNASRNVYSAYGEDTWKPLRGLSVTGGLRIDYYQGYETHRELAVNPRVAASYEANKHFLIKALYASAVRPPAIYESLGQGLHPLAGSLDIRSEKVQTMELSAIFRNSQMRIQLTPFYSLLTDRIAYVSNGEGLNVAQNSGTTRIAGAELDARYYFTRRTYAFANGAYIWSFEERTGRRTDFLPSTFINGGVNWNHDALNVNVSAHYRDQRALPPDLPVNASNNRYTFLPNAAVTYDFLPNVSAFLRVENVFDRDNEVPLAFDRQLYPLQRRTYSVGLTGSL